MSPKSFPQTTEPPPEEQLFHPVHPRTMNKLKQILITETRKVVSGDDNKESELNEKKHTHKSLCAQASTRSGKT